MLQKANGFSSMRGAITELDWILRSINQQHCYHRTISTPWSIRHQEDKGSSLSFLTLPGNITSKFFKIILCISAVGSYHYFRIWNTGSVTGSPSRKKKRNTIRKAVLQTEENKKAVTLLIWANSERQKSRRKIHSDFTYSLTNLYNQKI